MARENDVVLIYLEDSPVSFARIEEILPDVKRDWYHIKFLMLQIPLQVATWILKDNYINGEEFFMGGKKMRLEVVECPDDDTDSAEDSSSGIEKKPESVSQTGDKGKSGKNSAKIISFVDKKKLKEQNGSDK